MRWFLCLVLVGGCLRARATVVHPTDHERDSGASGSTIARTLPAASEAEQPDPSSIPSNLGSIEVGAIVPFTLDTATVHIAPGLRVFNSHPDAPLFGVAVGADFLGKRRGPGFALEGSVHAGSSGNDPSLIVQAVDVFGGITLHGKRAPMTWAVGPSVGILGMPGGHSVYTFGLGIRVMGRPTDQR